VVPARDSILDGLHFTRKGDKTRGEKPTITLKWGDALEIGAERMKDAPSYPCSFSNASGRASIRSHDRFTP
jgi:hypothetical protein